MSSSPRTANPNLAAALIKDGFVFKDAVVEDHRVVYVFEDHPHLAQAVAQSPTGTLDGGVKLLSDNVRAIMRLLHAGAAR